MNVGSLFAGIGGFDLGFTRAGFDIAWQVEIDPWCQRVLAKHWPAVPRYGDIKTVHGPLAHSAQDRCGGWAETTQRAGVSPEQSWDDHLRRESVGCCLAPIDILCGGFPCQPHSVAGKRKASADERDLWGEFARLIGELRPRYVVAENVRGLLSSEAGRFFGRVLGDLADLGYDAEWEVIRASDVGAPHRRERVWIVAYPGCARVSERRIASGVESQRGELRRVLRDGVSGWPEAQDGDVADADQPGPQGRVFGGECPSQLSFGAGGEPIGLTWRVEPNVGRVAHGVPARVDRLRGLGNAIVPQIAAWIAWRIKEAEGLK